MIHWLIWPIAPLALWIIWREVRRSAWRTLRDRYWDGGPYVEVRLRDPHGADCGSARYASQLEADTPYVTAMGTTVLED